MVLNLVLFQLGWFVCVLLGGVYALAITSVVISVHHALLVRTKAEWWFIGAVVATGSVADLMLTASGVLTFPTLEWGIPLWLICLWALFATTLNHSLAWLRERLLLGAVFAALAGPTSYFAGTQLTSAQLGEPAFQSLLVLSLCWALLFPTFLYATRFIDHDRLH